MSEPKDTIIRFEHFTGVLTTVVIAGQVKYELVGEHALVKFTDWNTGERYAVPFHRVFFIKELSEDSKEYSDARVDNKSNPTVDREAKDHGGEEQDGHGAG